MNTQFIASDENGDIQPTRVLNVTTEESYDLYENRFIYHLIQRLFAFVDKRTDVIFWSTGDETCNVMSMESKVDDAYEEISYKIEMTIKNRQSYAENDSDNMEIFKRIDRLRRMVRTLRSSAFCEIMSGCAKVHSPIQRTNLMMKDPSYRTCYKLWQFMESYDDVGYTIEERDTALEFDEEYLLQMYTNMITNYTVFKSLLESDPRKMSELAEKKYEPVRPKFVREIKEEIVEDRNIPDVEIRQVFVEEVTQAQLEAEEKLKQETERCQELERQNGDLEWEKETISQQLDFETQARIQAEQQSDVLQAQLDAVQSELETGKGEKKELEEQLHEAELAKEAKLLQDAGVDRITIMDSAGTMFPDQTTEYVKALKDSVTIPVGFHGHSNLGLSQANALAAVAAGADEIDCGLLGMARSVGNCATELAAATLKRQGYLPEVDLFGLLHYLEDDLIPTMEPYHYHVAIAPVELMLGLSGCHSSFLPMFRKVAQEEGVSLLKLIAEASTIDRKAPSESLLRDVAKKLK